MQVPHLDVYLTLGHASGDDATSQKGFCPLPSPTSELANQKPCYQVTDLISFDILDSL